MKNYTNDIFMEKICKKCKAEIRWIKTEKGKWMPVDPKEITLISIEGKIIKGYMPHWATCPNADYFRKEKCICACHDNKLKRPYAHETRCCDKMNGFAEDEPKKKI